MINFVIACNNKEELENNMRADFSIPQNSYIIQHGYTNVPLAYNNAIFKCTKEYICLLHQDVFLPEGWYDKILSQIKLIPEDWGVLGCAGVRLVNGEKQFIGSIKDRGCEWGSPEGLPVEVDTLDELLLIIKNDGRLWFDKGCGNHFYGADLCMQAKIHGKKSYAINNYVHHNSIHGCEVPQEFWDSRDYIKSKYGPLGMLPIPTTCTIVE